MICTRILDTKRRDHDDWPVWSLDGLAAKHGFVWYVDRRPRWSRLVFRCTS